MSVNLSVYLCFLPGLKSAVLIYTKVADVPCVASHLLGLPIYKIRQNLQDWTESTRLDRIYKIGQNLQDWTKFTRLDSIKIHDKKSEICLFGA